MKREHCFRKIFSGALVASGRKCYSCDVLGTSDYHIVCLFGGAIPLHIYEEAMLQMIAEEVIEYTPRELRQRLYASSARGKEEKPYVVIKQLQALTDDQWSALWNAIEDIPFPVVLPVGYWTPQKHKQLFHGDRVVQMLGLRMLAYTRDEVDLLLQERIGSSEQLQPLMKVSNGDLEVVHAALELLTRGHLRDVRSLKQALFEYLRHTREWISLLKGLTAVIAEEHIPSFDKTDVAAQFLRAVVLGERYSPEFGRIESPPLQLSTLGMIDYDARGMWGITSPVHACLGRSALSSFRRRHNNIHM